MAKTIQVRVDDKLKATADSLFESLGLDTSTAVRIFLIAAIEKGGIPFDVAHRFDHDADIREAIAYRKTGGVFLTSEQSLEKMRIAIKEGAQNGI